LVLDWEALCMKATLGTVKSIIDAALRGLAGRSLVSASEYTDVLLDVRHHVTQCELGDVGGGQGVDELVVDELAVDVCGG
jgi:hypothetical protein